jgi:type IV pilus assembly protein PilY1
MKPFNFRLTVAMAALAFVAAFSPSESAFAAISISDQPLFTQNAQPPLMMMVMSRDEQLFNKAYPDYTDLDGDGKLDTTYNNAFDYAGYFDPTLCYGYSGGTFAASGTATNHQCSSAWSGNFLNWVTMSRLDVLRFTFYGGYRSTDSTTTVLERANIPNDLHAWAKVYSGTDTASYTPYSGTVSFCNASIDSSGNGGSSNPPIMRVASGAFTEWSGTALNQCRWREEVYSSGAGSCSGAAGDNSCYDDPPKSAAKGGSGGFTVRVDVCDNSTYRESFCQKYKDGATTSWKPVGLLQTYGENGSMRFGLLTGSFSKPRSGGVLRRNIGKFAGNSGTQNAEGCAAGDEVNLKNGRFCNQNVGNRTPEGIVKTMNAFKLTQWDGSKWSDCNTYGILNRSGSPHLNDPGSSSNSQNCSGWGNPLSEMYAEALRYISAKAKTSGFNDLTNDLAGLPGPSWLDPYRSPASGGNPYCAKCNILVLSTGLNSFDSDEIPSGPTLPRSAAVSTTAVGTTEGISGNYLIGRVASGTPGDLAVGLDVATHTDLCTAKSVTDFSLVRGICPDIPSMEGSYLLDGLAYDAWKTDLRPELTGTDGTPKPDDHIYNNVKTFTVALAENLPKFQIPIGTGFIKMAPLCQANNNGSADALGGANDTGWRSCFLGAVSIGAKKAQVSPNYTYGRDLKLDGSGKAIAGSFTWVWEDSLWGNDHDNDVVTMVTYCVGDECKKSGSYSGYSGYDICWRWTTTGNDKSPACGSDGKPTIGSDEALVRIENLSAYAGNAMLTGYAMTGSNNDGLYRLTLRPGNTNDSILTKDKDPPSTWYKPMVRKFKVGTASAKQLENPLFYAAKYGSFIDKNSNGVPDAGEWDSEKAGTPDSFFAVTDPSKLKEELQKVFNQALTDSQPTASTATSTPRFVPGGTLAYQVSYNAKDWTGDVEAKHLNDDGTLGADIWSANAQLGAASARTIYTSKKNGTTFSGTEFSTTGLDTAMQTTVLGPLTSPYNIADLVAYLRGDQSKEEGATTPGPYRTRSSRIGDVLNSTPAVQGQTTFGYGRLPATIGGAATGSGTYQDFVLGKDTTPTVYVGANDGMLHAINGSPGTTGGQELFAYVPNAVLNKLYKLSQPDYMHTYYVDGSPFVGDAYDGSWHTVLLSSTGAGARAVFALDVTDPTAFDADSVMWEFNDQIDPDMGTAIMQPSLGLTEDGSWRVAIGNGLNSDSNHAILFVRDLFTADAGVPSATNVHFQKIDTGVGSAGDPNGLATATIVDTDGNGAGDTIYAGDYQGNLWKFVYTGSGWQIGNNAAGEQAPLFKAVDDAGHRQSITSGVYTVANPLGGTMVLFGTGRYLNTDDADPDHLEADGKALVDAIYAIWDAPPTGGGSPCSQSPAVPSRSNMQEQTITADNGSYLASSQTPFDFMCADDSGKMGWYLDMSYASGDDDLLNGDRVVSSPTVILGTLLVNTFQPTGDTCEPGGKNYLMELDALTGAANFSEIVSGGGGAPVPPAGSDTGGTLIGLGPPLGSPLPVVNIPTPPMVGPITCVPGTDGCDPISGGGGGSNDCKWTLPNPANKIIQTPIPCGRVSWRQLR